MNNNDVKIDYLPNHNNIKVAQGKSLYHFTSDSAKLGEYIKINKNDRVLDVGTNNGFLLLYASLKNNCKLYGIEINKKAIKYAKLTFKLNRIKAKIINSDFIKYKSFKKYDVIISNPPFFADSLKNKNINISNARHDDKMPLESFCKSIANNLKNNGKVYILYSLNRLDELIENMKNNNLKLLDQKDIVIENKKAKNTLLTFGFKC